MTFTTRPELRGTFGMVASTHWLASAVGMSVLERGGNAFDAACATGLTLHTTQDAALELLAELAGTPRGGVPHAGPPRDGARAGAR